MGWRVCRELLGFRFRLLIRIALCKFAVHVEGVWYHLLCSNVTVMVLKQHSRPMGLQFSSSLHARCQNTEGPW